MADTDSDLITKKKAARNGLPNGILNGDDAGGLVLRAKGIITLPAGVAAGDTFQICDLPPGVVPLPELSDALCSSDPGTTLRLDVGYKDSAEGGSNIDADGLAVGLNLDAGGKVGFTSGTMPAAVHTPFRTQRVTRLYATVPVGGATAVTQGVKVAFSIAYAMKG